MGDKKAASYILQKNIEKAFHNFLSLLSASKNIVASSQCPVSQASNVQISLTIEPQFRKRAPKAIVDKWTNIVGRGRLNFKFGFNFLSFSSVEKKQKSSFFEVIENEGKCLMHKFESNVPKSVHIYPRDSPAVHTYLKAHGIYRLEPTATLSGQSSSDFGLRRTKL